jgi:hypothetical protein
LFNSIDSTLQNLSWIPNWFRRINNVFHVLKIMMQYILYPSNCGPFNSWKIRNRHLLKLQVISSHTTYIIFRVFLKPTLYNYRWRLIKIHYFIYINEMISHTHSVVRATSNQTSILTEMGGWERGYIYNIYIYKERDWGNKTLCIIKTNRCHYIVRI